jgi:ParB-like chromosome segregation protein Spo0J
MPAHEHINQEQLRGLLAHDYYDHFDEKNYTVSELDPAFVWQQDDDHTYEELYDSIEKEGIKTPLAVSLKDNMLYDGHHRAVIARDLGIDKIPIRDVDRGK